MKWQHFVIAASIATTLGSTAYLRAQTEVIDPACECGSPPHAVCALASASCGRTENGSWTNCSWNCGTVVG